MDSNLRVAIDGGAATGKSTVAAAVAKELGLIYINTGLMYRLIGLFAKKHDLLREAEELAEQIQTINLDFKDEQIVSNWKFNLNELTDAESGVNASLVSSYPEVRKFAMNLQKQISSRKGILLEGRDIGTEIMPDANFKFFLTVLPRTAAERRYSQFTKEQKQKITLDELEQQIKDRNKQDSFRKVSPLRPASNAVIITTDDKTSKEVINEIINHVQKS